MRRIAIAIAFAAATVMPAGAGQSVNLVLNWTPAADHSAFYYAKAQGWYEKAGIDLTIEVGKGSGVSSLKVGSGGAPFGISDLATMLVARGKGADAVAVMSIYANTGQTFYWLKSYGISGPKDFSGRKIGNPPGDAARVMWPAFAKAAGLAQDSVAWVNVGPTAKSARRSGRSESRWAAAVPAAPAAVALTPRTSSSSSRPSASRAAWRTRKRGSPRRSSSSRGSRTPRRSRRRRRRSKRFRN